MRCIEIALLAFLLPQTATINRNMRCIEIPFLHRISLSHLWLIETWDVLKSSPRMTDVKYRIRLIETWDVLKFVGYRADLQHVEINRNMRCIEITAEKQRWNRQIQINRNMRCIEIGVKTKDGYEIMRINRNMRCIEINIFVAPQERYCD